MNIKSILPFITLHSIKRTKTTCPTKIKLDAVFLLSFLHPLKKNSLKIHKYVVGLTTIIKFISRMSFLVVKLQFYRQLCLYQVDTS